MRRGEQRLAARGRRGRQDDPDARHEGRAGASGDAARWVALSGRRGCGRPRLSFRCATGRRWTSSNGYSSEDVRPSRRRARRDRRRAHRPFALTRWTHSPCRLRLGARARRLRDALASSIASASTFAREPRAVVTSEDGALAYVAHATASLVSVVDLEGPEHGVDDGAPGADTGNASSPSEARGCRPLQWRQGFALARTEIRHPRPGRDCTDRRHDRAHRDLRRRGRDVDARRKLRGAPMHPHAPGGPGMPTSRVRRSRPWRLLPPAARCGVRSGRGLARPGVRGPGRSLARGSALWTECPCVRCLMEVGGEPTGLAMDEEAARSSLGRSARASSRRWGSIRGTRTPASRRDVADRRPRTEGRRGRPGRAGSRALSHHRRRAHLERRPRVRQLPPRRTRRRPDVGHARRASADADAGRTPRRHRPYGWNGARSTVKQHVSNTLKRLGGTGLDDAAMDALVAYCMHMDCAASCRPGRSGARAGRPRSWPRDATSSSPRRPLRLVPHVRRDVHRRQPPRRESKAKGDPHRRFDTPSLRFVSGTAPYFHDGRYTTPARAPGGKRRQDGAHRQALAPRARCARGLPEDPLRGSNPACRTASRLPGRVRGVPSGEHDLRAPVRHPGRHPRAQHGLLRGARALRHQEDGRWVWTTYGEFGALVETLPRRPRVARASSAATTWPASRTTASSGPSAPTPATGSARRSCPCTRRSTPRSGSSSSATARRRRSSRRTTRCSRRRKGLLDSVPSLKHIVAARRDRPTATGGITTYAALLDVRARRPPHQARSRRDTAAPHLHERHDGQPQGRHPHARQHRLERKRGARGHSRSSGTDRSLSFLPWAHSFGQTGELHAFLRSARRWRSARRVDKILDNLAEVKPTVLFSVPRIFNKHLHGGADSRSRASRSAVQDAREGGPPGHGEGAARRAPQAPRARAARARRQGRLREGARALRRPPQVRRSAAARPSRATSPSSSTASASPSTRATASPRRARSPPPNSPGARRSAASGGPSPACASRSTATGERRRAEDGKPRASRARSSSTATT